MQPERFTTSFIVAPGEDTPEHVTQALEDGPDLIAAALDSHGDCEASLIHTDDYGPVLYYSPERRLRQISRGEIREDFSSLALVNMNPPKPAWMPRWTLQIFRDKEMRDGALIWTAIVLVCLGFWGCVGLGFWGLHIVLTRGHL